VQAKKTLNSLVEAAEASGYKLYKETNYVYIFHRNTPKTFGVVSEYSGLAIGRNAQSVALVYPSVKEGDSPNLMDYTVRNLSRYKVIYLSGFQYSDRQKAEELLTEVANRGVKMIVDMSQIPVDPITSRMVFFDLTAQPITFSGQYPELLYRNKIYDAIPFKKEYSTWSTVYLENVKHTLGYSWFQNKELGFLGTGDNKNIVFMGYNFLYHAMETNDQTIISIMSEVMQLEPDRLPVRKIIPLTVSTQKDRIIIDSPGGKVNTTLSYQDNFRSEQQIINQNNLLTVIEPHTEIKIIYPYLFQGLAISIAGLLGIALLMYFVYREKRCS